MDFDQIRDYKRLDNFLKVVKLLYPKEKRINDLINFTIYDNDLLLFQDILDRNFEIAPFSRELDEEIRIRDLYHYSYNLENQINIYFECLFNFLRINWVTIITPKIHIVRDFIHPDKFYIRLGVNHNKLIINKEEVCVKYNNEKFVIPYNIFRECFGIPIQPQIERKFINSNCFYTNEEFIEKVNPGIFLYDEGFVDLCEDEELWKELINWKEIYNLNRS